MSCRRAYIKMLVAGSESGPDFRPSLGWFLVAREAAVRRGMFFYMLGLIVAMILCLALFSAAPEANPSPNLMVFVATLVVPMIILGVGTRLTTFPPPGDLKIPYLWFGVSLVVFAFWSGAYLLTGSLSQHLAPVDVATRLDADIPLRPVFVFAYLTVYPLFMLAFLAMPTLRDLELLSRAQLVSLALSYVVFLLVPVHFPHPIAPSGTFVGWTLATVYGNDTLANCFPSTHCSTSLVSALALFRVSRRWGAFGLVVSALIALSTLLIHQHYVLDVVAGCVVAGGTWAVLARVPASGHVEERVRRLREVLHGLW